MVPAINNPNPMVKDNISGIDTSFPIKDPTNMIPEVIASTLVRSFKFFTKLSSTCISLSLSTIPLSIFASIFIEYNPSNPNGANTAPILDTNAIVFIVDKASLISCKCNTKSLSDVTLDTAFCISSSVLLDFLAKVVILSIFLSAFLANNPAMDIIIANLAISKDTLVASWIDHIPILEKVPINSCSLPTFFICLFNFFSLRLSSILYIANPIEAEITAACIFTEFFIISFIVISPVIVVHATIKDFNCPNFSISALIVLSSNSNMLLIRFLIGPLTAYIDATSDSDS